MIARISALLLLLIVFPDVYIYRHYLYLRLKDRRWGHILWWTLSAIMLLLTLRYAFEPNFVPLDDSLFNIYLFLIMCWLVPKAIFAICSFIGLRISQKRGKHFNWGSWVGVFLAVATLWISLYGLTTGTKQLNVRHIDISFDNLPESFDGYKLVHFSDIHLGTYDFVGKEVLQRVIDSINIQHADAIFFTGDLVNVEYSEANKYQEMVASLSAKDGIFSVLGNHDYSNYINGTDEEMTANERGLQSFQRNLGWKLLMNESLVLRRGKDSIVIVGEEYGDKASSWSQNEIQKTLKGIDGNSFIVFMQHEPGLWKDAILPVLRPSLTLSGHTHGGQLAMFGLRATQILRSEDYGLYEDNGCFLYVTCGAGALLPFRYGVNPEIAVITLHRKQKKSNH